MGWFCWGYTALLCLDRMRVNGLGVCDDTIVAGQRRKQAGQSYGFLKRSTGGASCPGPFFLAPNTNRCGVFMGLRTVHAANRPPWPIHKIHCCHLQSKVSTWGSSKGSTRGSNLVAKVCLLPDTTPSGVHRQTCTNYDVHRPGQILKSTATVARLRAVGVLMR